MNVSFKENLYKFPKSDRILNVEKTVMKQQSFDTISINHSNDGKFSKKEAAKNFVKGVFSPIKAIVEHPIMSIGAVATTAIACSLVPVLTPIMSIGFGALSVIQLGKGVVSSAYQYKKGNYDKSEKAFEQIGQGTVGIATAAMSVRQNAKIVDEAKYMTSLEKMSLSFQEKTFISRMADKRSYIESLKNISDLFITKEGRNVLITQFKPFMIKQRGKELLGLLNSKNKKTFVMRDYDKKAYEKTLEGRRRSLLSEQELEQKVRSTFNEIFDELGIEEQYRPELVITNNKNSIGGSYSAPKHSIMYNTRGYITGMADIDEVIRHEAAHCERSLLRTSVSKSEMRELVISILKERILNGDVETVAYSSGPLGAEVVKVPRMSKRMRQDFVGLAETDLFSTNADFYKNLRQYQHQYSLRLNKSGFSNPTKLQNSEAEIYPFILRLRALLDKNPDFVAKYQNYDDAFDVLLKYARSQNNRYNYYISRKVGKDVVMPSGTAQRANIRSIVKDSIESFDGNDATSKDFGIFVTKPAMRQYQSSGEEVFAYREGNLRVIKVLTKELENLRKAGTLTPERESSLTAQIQRAKLMIEHNAKCVDYYKNYTQLLDNPHDSVLKAIVEQQNLEIESIMEQINKLRPQYILKTVSCFEKQTTAKPLNLLVSVLSKFKSKKEE